MSNQEDVDQRLVHMIDAIIKVSASNELKRKDVRKSLEEVFSIDMYNSDRRKIRKLMDKRFAKLTELKSSDSTQQETPDTNTKQEFLVKSIQLRIKKDTKSKRKQKRGDAKTGSPNEGLLIGQSKSLSNLVLDEFFVSPELEAVLEVDAISRTEAVKKIWSYIRAHKLQDPENKKDIICDHKLENLFKSPRIGMLELNRKLQDHILTKKDRDF